jgi:hypothetical protein
MRHRRVLGGLTAFAVAFSYVGANAVWYQPHAHGGAFFATRPLTAPAAASVAQDEAMPGEFETVIRLEREPEGAQQTPPAGPSIETIIAAPRANPAAGGPHADDIAARRPGGGGCPADIGRAEPL